MSFASSEALLEGRRPAPQAERSSKAKPAPQGLKPLLERSDQRFVPFAPWREKYSNLARKARVA